MKLNGVHHVSVEVADVEKAADFYSGVLGLERIERPDLGFPGVWFRSGAQEIHLIHREGHQGSEEQRIGHHFALRVEDIESARKELEAQGVRCSRVRPAPAGGWSAFLRDPSGNLIELSQS
jgi:glyoxylase I family protein